MVSTTEDALLDLVEGLRERSDELITALMNWNRNMPGYAAVPREVLQVGLREVLDVLCEAILGQMDRADLQRLAEGMIAIRVHFGIPIASQLRGAMVGGRMVFEAASAVVRERGLPPEPLATAGLAMFEVLDILVAEASAREGGGSAGHERFVYDALHGAATTDALAANEVDADTPVVAFRIRAATESGLAHAARAVGSVFTTMIAGDLAGFAHTIPELPAALDATVGVGPGVRPLALPSSFAAATRALDGAAALGRTGVCSLADLGLAAAVVDDNAIGDSAVARYLAPLDGLGEFASTLRDTLTTFFANGMRIDATAHALHVHTNTLRNRFRRYEELTGADLDNADDLVGVWWALKRVALRAGDNDGS